VENEIKMRVRPSVIIINDESILLLKYIYNGTVVYGIPGGNPDSNETLEECLIRELKEELSIEIEVEELILVCEVILDSEVKKDNTLHCVFLGNIKSGLPRINPDHTTSIGFEWVRLADMESINMYPNVGNRLRDILVGISNDIYIGRINQKWF